VRFRAMLAMLSLLKAIAAIAAEQPQYSALI
jgi:hypothetical protein